MSKLEDNVNEILGIEKDSTTRVKIADFEQPAPVPPQRHLTGVSGTTYRRCNL